MASTAARPGRLAGRRYVAIDFCAQWQLENCKTEEGNMPTGWVGACLPGCGVYDERGSGLSLASSESSIDGSTTDSTLCTQPNYTIVDDVKHPRAHQPLTSLVWRRCPSSPYSAASYLSQSVATGFKNYTRLPDHISLFRAVIGCS